MSSFLYLATGFDGATPSLHWLESRGLLEVLGRNYSCLASGNGEALLAAGSMPTRLIAYDAPNQNWAVWGDGVEFGFWTDERRPTEHGLRRARPLLFDWPVKPVAMGNGETWDIPICRDSAADILLPAVMRWNAGEGWTKTLSERHTRLRFLIEKQVASALLDAGLITDTPGNISAEEQCEMIREALALTYRVGPQEISALGLLIGDAVKAAAGAVINMDEAAGWIGEYLRRYVDRIEAMELAATL